MIQLAALCVVSYQGVPLARLCDVTMALRSLLSRIVRSSVVPVTPSIQCKQVTRNTFRYLSDMRTELCVALGKTLLSVINGDIKAIHPVLSNRDYYQLQEPKLLYDA